MTPSTSGLLVHVALTIGLTTTTTSSFSITTRPPIPSHGTISNVNWLHKQDDHLSVQGYDRWHNNHRPTSTTNHRHRRRSRRRLLKETQLSLSFVDLHFLMSTATSTTAIAAAAATATASSVTEATKANTFHLPNLLQAYASLLTQYPITTKCSTASILACLGDYFAQFGAFLQKKQQQLDQQQQQQQNQNDLQLSTYASTSLYNSNNENKYQLETSVNDQGIQHYNQPTMSMELQSLEEIKFQYDLERGIAFFLFGALYTGAFQHVWFEYLSNHVSIWGQELGIWDQSARAGTFSTALLAIADGTRAHEWFTCFDIKLHMELPPSPLAIATAKVFVNQFFMVPSLYMPLFFAVTGYVAHLDAQQSAERCRSLYFPLLFRNYIFWLPVQLVQFLFVPVQWQIPVQSVASLVWTIILSTIASSTNQSSVTPTTNVNDDQDSVLPLPEMTMIALASSSANGLNSANVINGNTDGTIIDNTPTIDPASNKAPVPRVAILDDVRVKDVIPEPIFDTAQKILVDNKVGVAGSGFAIGLLTAAADEAYFGAAVGALLGGETQLGVAVLSALGAGAGILAASAFDSGNQSPLISDISDGVKISNDTTGHNVISTQIVNGEVIEDVSHTDTMENELMHNTVTFLDSNIKDDDHTILGTKENAIDNLTSSNKDITTALVPTHVTHHLNGSNTTNTDDHLPTSFSVKVNDHYSEGATNGFSLNGEFVVKEDDHKLYDTNYRGLSDEIQYNNNGHGQSNIVCEHTAAIDGPCINSCEQGHNIKKEEVLAISSATIDK